MPPTEPRIVADVRQSETLDRLIVTPRRPTTALELKAAMGTAFPGVPLTRLAQGVAVSAADSPRLIEEPLSLRFVFTEEARRFSVNRARARRLQPALREAVEGLRQANRGTALARLAGLEGASTLDDHQVINVAAMTHPACYGLCLFDEQGAGKTVSVIYAWDLLASRDEVDLALIIAPKSMVPEWLSDLHRFKGDLYTARAVVGSDRDKRRALSSSADVLVTNFETVVAMEKELTAILRRLDGRSVLVADESFMVKNLDAQRTKALRRLREWCGSAYVLCGTPAPNSAHDLIQQFSLADFGLTFDGVIVPDEREAAHEVIKRAVDERGIYLRHLKREVLPDLPPKSFDVVRLEMKPVQSRSYEAALQSLIIDLQSTDDDGFRRRLTSFMARRSALLQICSNPSALVPGYEETPAKLDALEEILTELIAGNGEKVVVWSFFTASLEAVVERFGRFGPVRYDGTVTDVSQRRDAVRSFQEDEATRLFVGNPAAAGAGLTLHAARHAIYESFSNQAAHYLQSLDRIHRRGQDRDVRYIVLLCQETIEEAEFERLRGKERRAQVLLGDNADAPVTREGMLGELLLTATGNEPRRTERPRGVSP
jgi:SNF2 family DNA or RNA helicase